MIGRTLAIFCAATPFAFALIRAVRTGHDLRYLWVALASLCGAVAIMTVRRTTSSAPRVALATAVEVFAAATLLAVLAALLLGTTLGVGILVVALAFGFCFAAGALFYLLAS